MSSNFRQHFIGQLNLGARVSDARRHIESALSGDVLDIEKLRNVSLWVPVPHVYRSIVWKVLMGIVPKTRDAWNDVEKERIEQFEDLRHAVNYIYDDVGTEDITPEILVKMMLIEINTATPYKIIQIEDVKYSHHLLAIATGFLEICDSSEIDAFWMFKTFVDLNGVVFGEGLQWTEFFFEERIKRDVFYMNDLVEKLDPQLHARCLELKVDFFKDFHSWYASFFAKILSIQTLESIWDIWIGGGKYGRTILSFLGTSLLLNNKQKIEGMKSNFDFQRFISEVRESKDVRSTAISLWEKTCIEKMTIMERQNLALLGLN